MCTDMSRTVPTHQPVSVVNSDGHYLWTRCSKQWRMLRTGITFNKLWPHLSCVVCYTTVNQQIVTYVLEEESASRKLVIITSWHGITSLAELHASLIMWLWSYHFNEMSNCQSVPDTHIRMLKSVSPLVSPYAKLRFVCWQNIYYSLCAPNMVFITTIIKM